MSDSPYQKPEIIDSFQATDVLGEQPQRATLNVIGQGSKCTESRNVHALIGQGSKCFSQPRVD